MTWIRHDCGATDDELFDLLGEGLGISTGEAFYHYWALTEEVAERDTAGRLRGLPDRTLERWAKWTGTPGGFAGVFRGLCEDQSTGELRGFRKRNEKLLQRQAKDRQKRRNAARTADPQQNTPKTPGGSPHEPATNSGANVNDNDTTQAVGGSGGTPVPEPVPEPVSFAQRDERINYIIRCTQACNRALRENPSVAAFNELIAASQTFPDEWREAGIPLEVAVAAIADVARQYTPTPTNRQPSSLKYFNEPVRRAWILTQQRATESALPADADTTTAPIPRPRAARATSTGVKIRSL